MCNFTFLLFLNIYLALKHIAIKPIIPLTSTSHPSKKDVKEDSNKKIQWLHHRPLPSQKRSTTYVDP